MQTVSEKKHCRTPITTNSSKAYLEHSLKSSIVDVQLGSIYAFVAALKLSENSHGNVCTEAAIRRYSSKQVFLIISQNSQEDACARAFLFNKVAGLRHRCFSVNFAKFLRSLFL